MTLAFGIGNAELFEPARKVLSRVIGDDEERRCAGFVVYRERRRLVSRQKIRVSFIYGRFRWQWVVIDVAFVLGVGKSLRESALNAFSHSAASAGLGRR